MHGAAGRLVGRGGAIALGLSVCLLLTAGCTAYRDTLPGVLDPYRAGARGATLRSLDRAVDGEGVMASGRAPDRDRLLWLLERGKARFEAGLYRECLDDLELADEVMSRFRATEDEVDVPSQAAAIVWNDTVMSYRGRLSDRVMLRTYQAMAALALGEADEAQVYLRLAAQAQEDAVSRSAKRIAQARDAAGDRAGAARGVLASGDYASATRDLRTHINPAYAPYANPLTTFLSGLTLLARGDATNARVDLERALAMAPANAAVAAALQDAQSGSAAPAEAGGVVYVVYERGLVGFLGSTTIPIVQPFTGVSTITIPQMQFPPSRAGDLVVRGEPGEAGQRGQVLADFNAVRAADLEREMEGIIIRQVLSTALKEGVTLAGAEVGRRSGDDTEWLRFVAIAVGSLWKAASAGVDTRAWRLLGEDVQLVRLPRPSDGQIEVSAGNDGPLLLAVPEGAVSLVYVRSVEPGDVVAVSIGLSGGSPGLASGPSSGQPFGGGEYARAETRGGVRRTTDARGVSAGGTDRAGGGVDPVGGGRRR